MLSDDVAANFIAGLARSGDLRVYCLWVGERIAAVDMGFGSVTYRSLIGCYNLDFAQGSPGHVLTGRLLDRLRLDGTQRLDLLWPSDGYKLRLADGMMPLGARISSATMSGRVAAFVHVHLRPLAKQFAVVLSDFYRSRSLHLRQLKRSEGLPQLPRSIQRMLGSWGRPRKCASML